MFSLRTKARAQVMHLTLCDTAISRSARPKPRSTQSCRHAARTCIVQSVHWKRALRSPPSNPKLNCGKKSVKNQHWWRASTPFSHSTNPTLVNATLIAGYVGIRHLDGRLDQQAEATATSKLVFKWVTRRGGSEVLRECEVRCDNALERGVPYPGMPYCTIAELQQIALNSATAHEATLPY